MPNLKSGRHIALSGSSILDKIKSGTDADIYYWINLVRLEISSPQKLRGFLPVAYYREGEGEPPNAPAYESGFLVMDVLDGKASWTDEEVAEFANWLDTDPPLNDFVVSQFKDIDAAIRDSPVWDSPLLTDDEQQTAGQYLRDAKATPMSDEGRPPDFYDSLAAMSKFLVVPKIEPELHQRFYHAIEFANSFSVYLCSLYPSLWDELIRGGPLSVPEASELLRKFIPSLRITENDLNWIDTQMPEALRSLIQVVRDPLLPSWLTECRDTIEKSFHIYWQPNTPEVD